MTRKLSILCAVSFLLALLLTSVDWVCFNQTFYRNEYAKLNVGESIGITMDDLMKATDVLLDYTRGQRDDLRIVARIRQIDREVFNQREKDHMVDVRGLYLDAMKVRNVAVILTVICFAAGAVFKKDRWLAETARSYNWTSVVFLLGLSFLIGIALVDFSWFWTRFHYIFFAGNDLWLLDPRTDILIMMVPERFFFDLITRIILTFAVLFAVSNMAAYLYRIRKTKKLNI